jgi:hypothetical protein
MSSVELLRPHVRQVVRRFAVAWRNRPRRFIAPVAVLDHDATGYRFQYLPVVDQTVEGFRPFIGFPDIHRAYEAARLWPFFDLRVMDRKRPDFREYVQWLGLTADASQLDILSRSGGEQKGDNVYLVEAPIVGNDGTTESIFLVRGTSYAVRQHDTARVAESLRSGDELAVVDDVTNEANPEALLLATPDGAAVGWVPDLLIDYARQVRTGGGRATVLQNNGPHAPWHMRLLVRLSGHVAPGTTFFSGGVWPPLR